MPHRQMPAPRPHRRGLTKFGTPVSEASRTGWGIPNPKAQREHVLLAIGYMIGATIVFAASSATSKWLVATYPIGEILFTRSFISLVVCAIIILPRNGLAVFRTQR